MPNWCENAIEVYFSGADGEPTREEFVEFISGVEGDTPLAFDFECVLPLPNGVWDYNWATMNWGTKWKPVNSKVRIQDTGVNQLRVVSIWFDTAWGPSIPVSSALSERFPTLYLSHSYDEQGMDFGGFVLFHDGEAISELAGTSRSTTWEEIAEWQLENIILNEIYLTQQDSSES